MTTTTPLRDADLSMQHVHDGRPSDAEASRNTDASAGVTLMEEPDGSTVSGVGLCWVLASNIVTAIDYSLVMPTGYEYIQDMGGSSFFYGATIAAFPIGRICLLIPIGYWSDRKGFRGPFLTANALGIAGGLFYGLASALGSKWFALLGRFLGGCGATHPLSAWAARTYHPQKRVQIESMQKASSLVGVILGPALNAFFVEVNCQVGGLPINPRTLAGYVPGLLSFVLLIGFLFFVVEPPCAETAVDTMSPCKRLWTTGAWVCIYLGFSMNLQISSLDTIVSPINAKFWHFNVFKNSMVFAGLAILSLLGAVVGIIAGKRGIKPLRVVLVAYGFNLALGCLMGASLWSATATVNMQLLYASAGLGVISLLICAGPAGGLYQQACGNAQGLLGAMYTIGFAMGRPAGALLGGTLLNNVPHPLCIAIVAGNLLGFVFQWLVRHRLQRAEDDAMAAMSRQSACGALDSAIARSSSASFMAQ